jgi:hypothetical protein
LLEFNANTIAIKVRECNVSWALIGFSGPLNRAKKLKAWTNLHAFRETIEEWWLCFGDLNPIIDDTEKDTPSDVGEPREDKDNGHIPSAVTGCLQFIKKDDTEKDGGKSGSSSTLSFLKNFLFDLSAVDLGFFGNRFTWSNKRWGRHWIRERLDRGFASVGWKLVFPKAAVYHLGALNSNHSPLLVDTNPVDYFAPRPFRFEAVWAKDPRCFEVINKAWKKDFLGSASFNFVHKQSNTSKALKIWN